MSRRSGHAIVIGGSMAGLVAARVLADRFELVTIIERDDLPDGPDARKGVPQGRHAHGLLAAGENVLAELFPGIVDELVEGGAVRLDFGPDARWYQFGGYRTTKTNQELYATFFSRPFLEDVVRRRVTARPNVTLRPSAVSSLVCRDGRVAGVALADGAEVAADLTVDGSGRGSQASRWMEALGYDARRSRT